MIPLLEFARQATGKEHCRFYFPGHKGGQGLDGVWSDVVQDVQALGRLDFPELVGLWEAIASAEKLAAVAYGARRSWFLVNGSTVGLQASLLATTRAGDRVLMGRNCHRAAIAGLILAGAMPIYLPTECDQDWQIDLGVSPATLSSYLAEYPQSKAVVLVSPNYFGVAGNLLELVTIAHGYGVPVIVDGAHGAHLGFHPDLPVSALQAGADVVIHSTHKTGSALSQASILHWQGDLVEEAEIAQALQILQTTSPNFLLLLSLDIARWQLETKGAELLAKTLYLAQQVQARSPLRVFQRATNFDPTRVTVSTQEIGLTGFAADQFLTEWGVVCELPTWQNLVFSLSIGTSDRDIQQLLAGLGKLPHQSALLHSFLFDQTTADQPVIAPRQAYFAAKESVQISEAIDRISAVTICPYPPGIPVVTIGARISKSAVEFLTAIQRAGGLINGAPDPTLQTWLVIKE